MRPATFRHPLRAASIIGIAALLTTVISAPAAATPDPTPVVGAFTQHVLKDGVYLANLVAGSDGNVWSPYDATSVQPGDTGIAKVTPDGSPTYYGLPSGHTADVNYFTLGGDGNLWFFVSDDLGNFNVAKITPAGAITEYPLATVSGFPDGLVQGPGGDMWLMLQSGDYDPVPRPASDSIVRVGSAGTSITYPLPTGVFAGSGLIEGPDGNVWFLYKNVDGSSGGIGKMTSSGVVSTFPLTGRLPNNILAGADGNVWFGSYAIDHNEDWLNRITTSGVVASYAVPNGQEIIRLFNGPDGKVWLDLGTLDQEKIVRLSGTGSFTTVFTRTIGYAPIAVSDPIIGPDGNLWFATPYEATGPDYDDPWGPSTLVSVSSSGLVNTINAVAPATQMFSVVFSPSGQLWFSGADASASTSVVGSVDLAQVSSSRTAGADRYSVGVHISEQAYPSVTSIPVVYVATGSNYPDALSAGAPAALQGGPLLLTQGDTLPGSVKTEIQRLKPQKIVVVGGVNSVSATVFNQLKALQSNIVRLAGADRYAASRNIVDYAFGATGADTVYISTGANFPDALSAGGAGGAHNTPVLLVNGTAPRLDSATVALLKKLKVKHIKIAGGPNSVSPALETQLKTIAPTIRLSGADRFAASQSINEDAYSSATRVFLATGFNFPDALAGSAWAGSLHAPLYVVPGSCVPQQIINDIVNLGVTQVTLIGGTASLTQNVQNLQSCP